MHLLGAGYGDGLVFSVLPLFFSLALVMAVIALATHQIRQGFLLLAGAIIGPVICLMIFFTLVVGTVGTLAVRSRIATVALPRSGTAPRLTDFASPTPGAMPLPPRAMAPPVPPPVASNPLALKDVFMMLRIGLRDDEIIADASDKQLVDRIDSAQAASLREMGAGDKLLRFLQSRPLYAAPPMAMRAAVPARIAQAPPPVVPARAMELPPPASNSSEDKERRIETLKKQIDDLDEQVRRIRTNPRDSRYWYLYHRAPNGINQEAYDNYLKTLDQQRNDLRREKWRLEGR